MEFAKLCFGIYLIMASVMPNDVVAYSHVIGIREQLSELSNNDLMPQNENRHQVQLKFPDSASKFHREFQSRRRRSTKDDALFSIIANFIGQGKRQAAFLIYSKAIEIDGTPAFSIDYRTKLIKRIISDAYQQNQVAKILDFITFELNDSTQVCLWMNTLFETMKEKENLATMGALYLGRSLQRIRLLHVLNQNSDREQECDLRLLADTISKTLIQPTEQLVNDLAKSIVSDNNDQVIAAATDYPVAFDSIVHQLISIAVSSNNTYNERDGHLARRFRKKPFDFITRIPSLTTAIDALVFLNQTLRKSNINGMSKETILVHSIKKMEIKIKNANDLPFHYKSKFSELKNQIPLSNQRLSGVPYVFIYKIDKTKEDSRKFVSSKKKKYDLKRKFTQYSDTTDEGSMWILEPVNSIDQFRIKNQESGEYLYADDNISLDGFPNKRSVFTYNLSNGSDINTDSLIWVLNSVNGTKSERFTIMNLHWKEFLDSQKDQSPWNEDGQVYTLKDKVNSPKSAQEWIISSGGPYERPEARLVCFFDSLATQNQGDRFSADKIDPTLCTHLVYNRANIDNEKLVMKIGDEKIDKGYKNVLALKIKNPALKVMIAIGGQDIEENYSRLNSDPEKIKKFVTSAVNFLQKHKFDGLHFELQYLYSSEQLDGVTSLLTALKIAFEGNYLLSANVHITYGYDIPRLNETLDFIGLQAFNFHGPWDYQIITYRSSGFYATSDINADYAVNRLIRQGFSPRKIVLDIPFFGKTWSQSSSYEKPDVNEKDSGARNERTSQGEMTYYQICEVVKNGDWQVYQFPILTGNPHAFKPSDSERKTWVAYDNPDMAVFKANYILSKGLGGAYVSDLSQDDYLNICGGGINPMLTAIADTLGIKEEAHL